MDAELREEIFEYLDEVRESGSINMFAATLLITSEFELRKREAEKVLFEWMEARS